MRWFQLRMSMSYRHCWRTKAHHVRRVWYVQLQGDVTWGFLRWWQCWETGDDVDEQDPDFFSTRHSCVQHTQSRQTNHMHAFVQSAHNKKLPTACPRKQQAEDHDWTHQCFEKLIGSAKREVLRIVSPESWCRRSPWDTGDRDRIEMVSHGRPIQEIYECLACDTWSTTHDVVLHTSWHHVKKVWWTSTFAERS